MLVGVTEVVDFQLAFMANMSSAAGGGKSSRTVVLLELTFYKFSRGKKNFLEAETEKY